MKSKPFFHKWYKGKEQAEFPNLKPRRELARPAKRIRFCILKKRISSKSEIW